MPNTANSTTRVIGSPITRPAEHEKIELFLDGDGQVEEAYWQPELKEYDRFCIGRPAEEMPRIAPSLCGFSSSAHHLAATKALDDLYSVEPTPAARLIRELQFNAFYVDHFIRLLFSVPEFAASLLPVAGNAQRRSGSEGIIDRLGSEIGLQAMAVRAKNRLILSRLAGRASHPEGGLPGGVSRGIAESERASIREAAADALGFVRATLERFRAFLLADRSRLDLILNRTTGLTTYTVALVDRRGRLSFCDGRVRIVDPEGKEHARFDCGDYEQYIGERTDPRSLVRLKHLREPGWQGLVDGAQTSLFRVDPLAQVDAADAMQTPLAQREAGILLDTLGGKPWPYVLATPWARLICALQAAERSVAIASKPQLTSRDIRNMDLKLKGRGVGAVEAPHGLLFHHYETDENGVLTKVIIIDSARNSVSPISLAVKKAGQEFIEGPDVREGFLDRVEMIFRAFVPFLSAAACFEQGKMPLEVTIRNSRGDVIREIRRNG